MPAERSQRVEQRYHEARQCDPGERATFLQQVCAGDDALRGEVESLLAEDAGVKSFLETPAVGAELAGRIEAEGACALDAQKKTRLSVQNGSR